MTENEYEAAHPPRGSFPRCKDIIPPPYSPHDRSVRLFTLPAQLPIPLALHRLRAVDAPATHAIHRYSYPPPSPRAAGWRESHESVVIASVK